MISQSNKIVCSPQSAAIFRPSTHTFLQIILALCLLSLSPASSSDQTTTENKISLHGDQASFQKGALECKGIAKSALDGALEGKSDILPQVSAQLETLKCLASVKQIHDAREKGEALIVDVRRSEQYQAFHIPGSLNLASYSVKSKPFLKNKRRILVNEGHYHSHLDDLCDQLRSAGFKDVAVMEGGLFAWSQAGYGLQGDRLEILALNALSPADFIASLSERNWRILDLDESLNKTERILPESQVIQYKSGKVEVIKAINQAQRQFNSTTLNGFLVVSRDGKNYTQASELLQLTDAKDTFYLSGGIDAFNQYLQTHSSLIERLSHGFREQSRCSG